MKQFFAAVLALFLAASPAFALDLQQARANGQIGEKNDGYVAVLSGGADVAALAGEINAKRKQEYARISNQNGQPVELVAKLAAGQIIGGLGAGMMYQDNGGNWKKK